MIHNLQLAAYTGLPRHLQTRPPCTAARAANGASRPRSECRIQICMYGNCNCFDLSLAHASHRAQYRETDENTSTVESPGNEMNNKRSYEQINRRAIEFTMSGQHACGHAPFGCVHNQSARPAPLAASRRAQRATQRPVGTGLSQPVVWLEASLHDPATASAASNRGYHDED